MADLSGIDAGTMPSDDFQVTDVTVPHDCRVIWKDKCWPRDQPMRAF
jgi:hypothetical protein